MLHVLYAESKLKITSILYGFWSPIYTVHQGESIGVSGRILGSIGTFVSLRGVYLRKEFRIEVHFKLRKDMQIMDQFEYFIATYIPMACRRGAGGKCPLG